MDDVREQERVDRTYCGMIAKSTRTGVFGDLHMMGYVTTRDRARGLRDEKKTRLDEDTQALNTFQTQLNMEKEGLEKLQQQLNAAQQESSAISARIAPMQHERDLLSTLSVCRFPRWTESMSLG